MKFDCALVQVVQMNTRCNHADDVRRVSFSVVGVEGCWGHTIVSVHCNLKQHVQRLEVPVPPKVTNHSPQCVMESLVGCGALVRSEPVVHQRLCDSR